MVKISAEFIPYWKVTILFVSYWSYKKDGILVIGLTALILTILHAKNPLF